VTEEIVVGEILENCVHDRQRGAPLLEPRPEPGGYRSGDGSVRHTILPIQSLRPFSQECCPLLRTRGRKEGLLSIETPCRPIRFTERALRAASPELQGELFPESAQIKIKIYLFQLEKEEKTVV
jgi:hypothetical protein